MKIFKKSLLTSTAIVMSAIFAGCSVSGSDSPEEPVKISPESITFEWQSAYENKLNEFKNSGEFSADSVTGSRFDLVDITNDGTPELIISPNNTASASCEIYSCINGYVTSVGTAGSSGEFNYLPNLKLIKDEYQGNAFVLGKYLTYENGELTSILTYKDNSKSMASGGSIIHEINGEEVLLPEYDAALAPYEEEISVNIGRKYTFGETAVKYALKRSESWGAVLNLNEKNLFRAKLTEKLTEQAEHNYAFELCDLNGDDIPELIISDGTDLDSSCEIYYLAGSELIQAEGKFGENGKFSFDTENLIFFTESSYWSINNDNFSAENYTASESIVEIGRKNLLTSRNIDSAF